jgi:hypothetical protein
VIELLDVVKVHLEAEPWCHHRAKSANYATDESASAILLFGAHTNADVASEAVLALLVFNTTGDTVALFRSDTMKHP